MNFLPHRQPRETAETIVSNTTTTTTTILPLLLRNSVSPTTTSILPDPLKTKLGPVCDVMAMLIHENPATTSTLYLLPPPHNIKIEICCGWTA